MREFISYAREDLEWARERARVSRQHDVTPFLDIESMRDGDDWPDVIKSQIYRCDQFVLGWSRHAARSRWVEFEYTEALRRRDAEDLRCFIVVEQLDSTPIPPPLTTIHRSRTCSTTRVSIRIEKEFKNWNTSTQLAFQIALSNLLEIPEDEVEIKVVKPGSIIVVLELEESAAAALVERYSRPDDAMAHFIEQERVTDIVAHTTHESTPAETATGTTPVGHQSPVDENRSHPVVRGRPKHTPGPDTSRTYIDPVAVNRIGRTPRVSPVVVSRARREAVARQEARLLAEHSPGLGAAPPSSQGSAAMSNEDVWARYALPIEKFFANKVAEPSLVEDLMHETFARFFQRRKRGDAEAADQQIGRTGPFLMGIAKNVLFEFWRSKGRRERTDDIGELSVADLSQGLPSRASEAERFLLIHEALRQLPLNHQIVLELHYWQNVPYKEVAEVLDVPFGTVATWGRAGRNAVRQYLEKELGRALPEDEANARAPAHPWYDARTGAIDLPKLAVAAMVGKRARAPRQAPPWLRALEMPSSLPNASASELSEIGKAAWEAWVKAGRPELE